MKHVLLILFVAVVSACAHRPASMPASQAALQLESAIAGADRDQLERLLAADFLWVRGSGETGDKQAFISALTSERLDIEPFTAQHVRWFEDGNLALQSGVNILKGTYDGEAFVDRHRFADLWRWHDGRWELVYAQVTRLGND